MSSAKDVWPPLIAVAHGSRNPRSPATVRALADLLAARRPELDVRVAFLELSQPRLATVLARAYRDGHRDVVVAPLLLGRAYHAGSDIPAVVAGVTATRPGFRVRVADVLVRDDRLERAALRRLADVGVSADDPGVGVLLAGAGSTHRPANDAVRSVGRRLAERTAWAGVTTAFATATPGGGDDVATAVERLRTLGAQRIAMAPWFLAAGTLTARVVQATLAAAPDASIAEPLGACEPVADVLADRYAAACAAHTADIEHTSAVELGA